MTTKSNYFIGVDVGSGSVRAALVTSNGCVKKVAVKEIQTWKPKVDHFEQSSNDIWMKCLETIKVITVVYLFIIMF